MVRRPFSKPVHAEEERNGQTRADQGLSTAKPRSSHVTWARFIRLFVHRRREMAHPGLTKVFLQLSPEASSHMHVIWARF